MCTGAEWTSNYDGYPCPNTIVEVPVTVDMESGDWNWINGLIVVPATHAVDVPLDKSVEVFSSTILVDTYVANGAAYEVLNTGGSNCVSTLSVSSGAAGELARMIEHVLTFSVTGSEDAMDFASGAPTECTAVVRLVDDTSRNETISFTISPKRGEPSSLSLVGDVTATASSPAQFTFQPRDRLGNLCDRQWEGVRFTLTAVASDGSQYPLPGSSSATNSLDHVLSVQSLELRSGSYSLQGYLLLPNRTETVPLTDVAALSVSPVSCQAGETSVGGGQSCVCAAGYYAAEGTCSPCEADTYKEGAGDALSCTPCPDGGATAGTGATSSSDCTCPTNSELNSAGNACECAPGYYGSGGACAVCGAGTYKGTAGNALGCTSCPAGASTGGTGSTSFSDCACPTNSELNSAGDACECIVGYFGSGGSCTACGLGSYKVDAGDALGCVPCPGGATTTFQAALSVDNCTAPLNTELDGSGQKYICLAGFSGSGSSGTCSACALNTFKSGAGDAVECNSCPTGATTVSTGSTASSDCTCPANSELNSAGDACECVAGYYGSGGACTACEPESFKQGLGDVPGCTSCPTGASTVSSATTSFFGCVCPANSQLNDGGEACECVPGFYGSQGSCSACDQGTYKENLGDSLGCVECPPGGWTSSVGSTSRLNCTAAANAEPDGDRFVCSPGFYGPASDCTPCELGTFKSEAEEAFVCEKCVDAVGPGSTTAGVGSKSVDDCVCEKAFFRTAEGKCRACPVGASCGGRVKELLELRPGYWRASSKTLNIIRCEEVRGEDVCRGSKVDVSVSKESESARVNVLQCREGHAGNLCSECGEGYGKRLGLCEKCSEVQAEAYLFLVLGVGGVFFAVYLLVSQHLRRIQPSENGKCSKQNAASLMAAPAGHAAALHAAGRPGGAAARRGGAVLQLARAPPGAAPRASRGPQGPEKAREEESLTNSVVKVLVTWLQLSSLAASVNVRMSPSVDTMLDWQSLGNVSPWSFGSFNCVFRFGYYARFYSSCLMPVACVGVAAAVVGLRLVLGRKRLSGHELDVGIMATQLLWLLTYTMVTQAVLGVFKCRELDDDLWVLSQDASVVCGTPSHRQARRVGAGMLVLHTLGVPLQAAAFMRWRQHDLGSLQMRVRFGFLYENYRPETFWYECFGMLRKASMVAAVVLLQDQTGLQVFTVSWVALTYLTVHSSSNPYDVEALNRLETFALFVSAATLSSCSFFYAARGRGSGGGGGDGQRGFEQAVSSIVIGLSAVLLAWCLALVIQDITGIRLLGRGASHGARGGGGAAEVLDPLAAGGGGGGGGGGKAGAAPRGSSARLPGPARPQTGEPVWFGDAWDAAPSAGGGDVHEVANPVAAAQKPGAGGASGAPGARGRPPAVVTPNPLLGGRLSNAQDLAGGRGEGGGASPWVRYLAYDGHYEYFHNTATGEVSWERPPDFREEVLSPPRI